MPSLFKRFHRRLWKGSDAQRSRYAAVRSAARPISRLRRRRLAASTAPEAGAHSDPARGFWSPPSSAMPSTTEVVEETLRRVEQTPIPAGRSKEHMWQGYLRGVGLELDSPFLRFALHPTVVDMAASYLGEVPLLASVEIWNSWWTPEPRDTMHWHLDWDDVTQLKVFVPACDIGLENGPTHAIDAERSKWLANRIRYDFRGSLESYMLTDGVLERELGSFESVALTGPKGSVKVLDTSRCFHMGGRMAAPGQRRIVTIFQYLRLGAASLGWNPRRAPYARIARGAKLDPRSRLVLGAS